MGGCVLQPGQEPMVLREAELRLLEGAGAVGAPLSLQPSLCRDGRGSVFQA